MRWKMALRAAVQMGVAIAVLGCDGAWLPGETCPYRSGSSAGLDQPVWTEEECAFTCGLLYTFTLDETTGECGTCSCDAPPDPDPDPVG
jgi:hypothetical protein